MVKDKIIDYISGREIFKNREEIESVQPLCRELVEELGYPKKHITTIPQFRVKRSPSDNSKSYPVDIALFKNETKNDENLIAIFECKENDENKGVSQLKNYLDLSNAKFGVWDNGLNRKIFLKKQQINGISYIEVPSIPKFKELWDSVGIYKKINLIKAKNLKNKFKTIRNYLAANNTGATRDEKIAEQIIYIIFTKLYDEKYTKKEDYLNFSYSLKETPKIVSNKIKKIWSNVKKDSYNVFSKDEKISLSEKSIAFVVKELQQYSFMNSNRHIISEAFETFIGNTLKGEQGQFFTPRNVIKLAVKIIDPNINDKIIDPACGTGGFLIESTKYVWNKIEKNAIDLGWNKKDIYDEQKNYTLKYIFGIDKDNFLTKVTKAYMILIGDGKSGIFNTDSLNINNWTKENIKEKIKYNSFDCVFANPPFGSKLKIENYKILKNFEIINYKNKPTAPQILFIEHCLKLLKNKGKLAIILPDAILGNKQTEFIREYIKNNAKVLAIISLPLTTFQPNTSTKTSLLILEKNNINKQNYKIFISTPKTAGHNRRGVRIESDEISKTIKLYKDFKERIR